MLDAEHQKSSQGWRKFMFYMIKKLYCSSSWIIVNHSLASETKRDWKNVKMELSIPTVYLHNIKCKTTSTSMNKLMCVNGQLWLLFFIFFISCQAHIGALYSGLPTIQI